MKFANVRGEVRLNENLSSHTSFRIGGHADALVVPADREDLITLLAEIREQGIPSVVLGGGTTLLVRDGGSRGVVISLKQISAIKVDREYRSLGGSFVLVHAEAGAALGLAAAQLSGSRAAVKHVVIVSDGEIHDADYTASMARRAAEQGTTVSGVWLRSGTSRADPTARIARVGGGRSIPFDDITQVPRFVSSEVAWS